MKYIYLTSWLDKYISLAFIIPVPKKLNSLMQRLLIMTTAGEKLKLLLSAL